MGTYGHRHISAISLHECKNHYSTCHLWFYRCPCRHGFCSPLSFPNALKFMTTKEALLEMWPFSDSWSPCRGGLRPTGTKSRTLCSPLNKSCSCVKAPFEKNDKPIKSIHPYHCDWATVDTLWGNCMQTFCKQTQRQHLDLSYKSQRSLYIPFCLCLWLNFHITIVFTDLAALRLLLHKMRVIDENSPLWLHLFNKFSWITSKDCTILLKAQYLDVLY